jgi:hypothetical protein
LNWNEAKRKEEKKNSISAEHFSQSVYIMSCIYGYEMKRQKEPTGRDLSRTSYQCGHCGLKAALAGRVGSVRWQSGRSYEPFPFYFFSLRQDWHVRTIYFCIHTRVSRGIALGFCILFFLPVRRLKCCLAFTLGILQFIFCSSIFFSTTPEKSYYIERHVSCLRVVSIESGNKVPALEYTY